MLHPSHHRQRPTWGAPTEAAPPGLTSVAPEPAYLRRMRRLEGTRWAAWVMLGVTAHHHPTRLRRVVLTNVAALAVPLTHLYFLLLFAGLLREPALIASVVWPLLLTAATPLVWWLNARGRHAMASTLLWAIATTVVLAMLLLGQGQALGLHNYQLLIALYTPICLGLARWRAVTAFVAVNLALYAIVSGGMIPPDARVAALPEGVKSLVALMVMLACAVTSIGLVCLLEFISADSERRLMRLADTDALTGLYNRRRFALAFAAESERARRLGQAVIVAMVDIDHFKRVNDTLGHDAGDVALCHVAATVASKLRPYDVVARLGGEEFGVLMVAPSLAAVAPALERIRHAVEASPFVHAGVAHRITVSLGAAMATLGSGLSGVLSDADQALYQAKRTGRNRVCLAGEHSAPDGGHETAHATVHREAALEDVA